MWSRRPRKWWAGKNDFLMWLIMGTLVGKASGKTYTRDLLRTSYREDGQVKHRTVANLSRCTPQEIKALRLVLRPPSAIYGTDH